MRTASLLIFLALGNYQSDVVVPFVRTEMPDVLNDRRQQGKMVTKPQRLRDTENAEKETDVSCLLFRIILGASASLWLICL